MDKLIRNARRAGPYVLVELLLPGGSLIALGMLLVEYRKRLRKSASQSQLKGVAS